MKLNRFLILLGLVSLFTTTIPYPITSNAQENSKTPRSITNQIAQRDPVNLILYETKNSDSYTSVAYMPYYPAYGMIVFKTPHCKAELTGFVDPFLLQKNQLTITYKKCKISFQQKNQELITPQETEACEAYHPKDCNFSNMPNITKIDLSTP